MWRSRGMAARLLFFPSLLFALLAALRRAAYRVGALRSARLPVPVVVVGNITVGGSGKTPLTLYLAQRLRALGRRPGIVSRGYGGAGGREREVRNDSSAADVGDEPLLLKRHGDCPVFVGRNRAAAAGALLEAYPACDLILCDDGLQHYALHRDVEIAVLDRRGVMNGWRLPAGPLREDVLRLAQVDALVLNGLERAPLQHPQQFHMRLLGDRFRRLDRPSLGCAAADLSGLRLHAVAGIGEPQRFFDHLATLGLVAEPHPFPDHHVYCRGDFDFGGDAILTTEKDAVKFAGLAPLPVWVLPVHAEVDPDLAGFVVEKIDGRPPA
ncbi:MAG: tetraacyldisaccharide 4'-kinase [Rhodocyclaceae bacterium]|nr:tetraacyldisaccharide 4'-kinase [Rhodocyclaceae bacterium]